VPVHVADAALDIDALADGGVRLQLQFFPEFSLPGQDERHGALGVIR